MDTTRPFGSPEFAIVAKGLVALHQQFLLGDDDSPEAEAIRDSLDGPMLALNQVDEKRAQWLSEDLYAVSEPSATFKLKEMNPQAQQKLKEAADAWERQDWDHALELLRRWKDYLTPAKLSFRRGAIWRGAGHPSVAAMFYGFSHELEPTSDYYLTAYLNCLRTSDPELALALAEGVLSASDEHPPSLVTVAANIWLDESQVTAGLDSVPFHEKLASILTENLRKITTKKATVPAFIAVHGWNCVLLGSCYRSLGKFAEAIQAYTMGLTVAPTDCNLLLLRGILSYDSPQSLSDFQRAVQHQSPLLYPALFLAHHALITGQFRQCLDWCELALGKVGPDAAKGELENWRAISRARLGWSPELVRAAFESAIHLDPTNEMARRNLVMFEALLNTPGGLVLSEWQRESEASVSRAAELATRRPGPFRPAAFAA